MEKDNKKSNFNSLITFGFGSLNTGFTLYWSNDALKTLEKHVYQVSSIETDIPKSPSQNDKDE